MTVRHGQIQDANITGVEYSDSVDGLSQDQAVSKALVGRSVHQIGDWDQVLNESSPVPPQDSRVGKWLNSLFGVE